MNYRELRHGEIVQLSGQGCQFQEGVFLYSTPLDNFLLLFRNWSALLIYLAGMGNTFKTALLLTALTLFLLFMGQIFGGQRGMELALGLAIVMNFVSYFFSDKIALAMYRAQPVTREQLPRAYEVVERLTQKMGIPMPKIYVIPTDSPNAFATGRNPQHASVAVTEGILNLLNDEELEGVLAHELGHVRNRDILISSVAATLAGAITCWRAWVIGRRCSEAWAVATIAIAAGWLRAADADPGPYRGHIDSAGCLALARISGRRHRRAAHRQSLRPGQRTEETGRLLEAHPDAGFALDSAPVHRGAAAQRRELRESVLDPSSYR